MADRTGQQVGKGTSSGVSWRLVVGLVLLVAVVIVVLQNTQDATFEVLWADVTAPLWILLVATLVVGFLIGWLANVRRARRAKK